MSSSSPHLPQLRKWLAHSPPGEWLLEQVRGLLIGTLRAGPIPAHIGFVMDGNRRFAKAHAIETIEGHSLGFEALARVLEVCYRSGVRVVSIYAFSVENFKRSRREVGSLMEMARMKLDQLSQHGDLLNQYGACIQIVGQRELIPADVQASVNRAIGLTAGNSRAVLNVCFPYTSRDEIASAMRAVVAEWSAPLGKGPAPPRAFSEHSIARGIRARRLSPLREDVAAEAVSSSSADADGTETTAASPPPSSTTDSQPPDSASASSTLTHNTPPSSPEPGLAPPAAYKDVEAITAATLDAQTYMSDLPACELLVRTSGVHRLSDFMLWQCHEATSIVFLDCLWPEFGLWHFLPVLVEWQWWKLRGGSAAAVGERDDGASGRPKAA